MKSSSQRLHCFTRNLNLKLTTNATYLVLSSKTIALNISFWKRRADHRRTVKMLTWYIIKEQNYSKQLDNIEHTSVLKQNIILPGKCYISRNSKFCGNCITSTNFLIKCKLHVHLFEKRVTILHAFASKHVELGGVPLTFVGLLVLSYYLKKYRFYV